jgi:nucleotide-binding universal stress UspA family protein
MFTIVHPTDLTVDEQRPFAHAVALASHASGKLVALHANRPGEAPVGDIDSRPLLRMWGRNQELPFTLLKHSCCEDPIDTALDALSKNDADLLVVGTHQRHGIERAFKDSFSESLALETKLPTLFVPIDGKGVLDMDTGDLTLKHVVVPVGGVPPSRAIDATVDLLARAEVGEVRITLLHVGDDPFPDMELPTIVQGDWRFVRETRAGRVDDAIVEFCESNGVDMVVMCTEGHKGVLDFLRGSKTERVLRRAACPVLSVALE